MDSLKCIGDEFYGDYHHGLSFPALKNLEISGMPNLEDWSSSSKGGELEVFPSLEVLILHRCHKLRTLPRLPSFLKKIRLECPKLRTLSRLPSSLEYLHLRVCSEMVLERLLENVSPNSSSSLSTLDIGGFDDEILGERSWPTNLRKLACLQNLKISSWGKMKILPEELPEEMQKLSSLISLGISECNELVCLPEEMQKLASLESFHISGCPSLKALPELGSRNNTAMTSLSIRKCVGLTSVSDCLRHLSNLESLVINGTSPELEFLQDDFQDLTSLRHLSIMSLPQMKSLPEGLQQVAGTLEDLSIFNCDGLTSLPEWMYKFTSLRSLYIDNCENLKVWPEEVLRLTVNVTIRDCHPDLHRRYSKETGKDWHKIAHIPNLDISLSTGWEGEHGGEKTRMKCINKNIISCFSSSSSSSGTN